MKNPQRPSSVGSRMAEHRSAWEGSPCGSDARNLSRLQEEVGAASGVAAQLQKVKRFWNYPFLEKMQSIEELYWLLKTRFYYGRFFGHIGESSKLVKPMRLKNVHNIYIHDES